MKNVQAVSYLLSQRSEMELNNLLRTFHHTLRLSKFSETEKLMFTFSDEYSTHNHNMGLQRYHATVKPSFVKGFLLTTVWRGSDVADVATDNNVQRFSDWLAEEVK